MNASYSVIGVEVFSNTSATFTLATGGIVVLEGGLATYIDSGGTPRRVCASDITCSAFSVTDPVDAQSLIQQAEIFDCQREAEIFDCQREVCATGVQFQV